MDAKSRPSFKEIVQQLEEALAFPLTISSNLSGSRRCPVVTTRSNPCSTALVEARSEEFLLQTDGPEENNHNKCNARLIIYHLFLGLPTKLKIKKNKGFYRKIYIIVNRNINRNFII